jgi:hypothetical protein
MGNNFDRMWAQAGEKVLEIIADDDQWGLFVQQVEQHGIDLNEHKNARERARTSEDYRAFLQGLYIHYSATQICDACDYNPNHRRGQRKFSARNRFDCDWMKTQGDVLAEQTAKEEGHRGALYNFNNPAWKAKYQELSQVVLEEHKDRTKAPTWLDTQRNLCPHCYIDLTRP